MSTVHGVSYLRQPGTDDDSFCLFFSKQGFSVALEPFLVALVDQAGLELTEIRLASECWD